MGGVVAVCRNPGREAGITQPHLRCWLLLPPTPHPAVPSHSFLDLHCTAGPLGRASPTWSLADRWPKTGFLDTLFSMGLVDTLDWVVSKMKVLGGRSQLIFYYLLGRPVMRKSPKVSPPWTKGHRVWPPWVSRLQEKAHAQPFAELG